MISNEKGLIRPLNLSDVEYPQACRRRLPRKIVISINVLSTDTATHHDISRINIRHRLAAQVQTFNVKADPLGIFRDLPCHIEDVVFCAHPLIITSDVVALLTPEQRAWLYQGCYVVVSFHQPVSSGIEHLHDGNGFAMVMLDRMVCLSKSLNPRDHRPFNADEFLVSRYEEAVCIHYATGVSVHNQGLTTLRNELSVVARAIAADQNVFRKLEEFRTSKQDHFLLQDKVISRDVGMQLSKIP